MAQNYPGLSDEMNDAIELVARGGRPDFNKFNVRTTMFWHRVNYITGGSAPTVNKLSFFNVTQSAYVSNWNANGLPQDKCALLQGVRIVPEFGVTLSSGAADANSTDAQRVATAALLAANIVRLKQWLNTVGLVNMKVGDRPIIENIYGTGNFPAGKGVDGWAAGFGSTSTMEANVGSSHNGAPQLDNVFGIAPWLPVLPGKQIDFSIDFQAAHGLTVTSAEVNIRVELPCLLISPANG